ncbi:Ribonuclease HII [Candidatus Clavichlamydia salmonicola]|uniref:ribonuclease HII n=1 Tax=Candidatus Clavichlamydia salmonicola TaxID=469812 RepID=UPI001890D16C|nr:ribonuclease HII [Candidatus Clavichlamydia salmonicola]MBF5050840.1 Ribonuclease HII [Candidatus Clavichlamydia salmonicola]
MEHSEFIRLKKLAFKEEALRKKGFTYIAGIDEAGRGPWAGPVVAAACMISQGIYFKNINDSKQLSSVKRRQLFEEIRSHEGVSYGIGIGSVELIDKINILEATKVAMRQAVRCFEIIPDYLLTDGLLLELDSLPGEKMIKGDAHVQCIAAASIIAKETRDAIMIAYDDLYPGYSFACHKGYGTAVHRAALDKKGPSQIHRLSFAPVIASLKNHLLMKGS